MTPKHIAKKSLGQNFLADLNARQRIVDACQFNQQDTVIEIGPGQGALTTIIAPRVKRLIAIETDRDLIAPLQEQFQGTNVEIIQHDFLTWDMSSIEGPVKVIGNIPYYISTPIIERLIEQRHLITQAWLTVQLEFAQRLVAKVNTREYGSLTCFVNYYTEPKMMFRLNKGCFSPVPKVDSAFVALPFRKELLLQGKDESKLFHLIQTAFAQRRKNILNALSALKPKAELEVILKELHISPTQRPETLQLIDFINIMCLCDPPLAEKQSF